MYIDLSMKRFAKTKQVTRQVTDKTKTNLNNRNMQRNRVSLQP